MTLTKDKIIEAQEIIRNGRDKCFDISDWEWAIMVLQMAFRNGHEVVKTS